MVKYFKNDLSSECGSPDKIQYKSIVNDDGTITLEEAGKIDFQGMIQSYAESCDMNIIINRIMNGEVDLLDKRHGIFGDMTEMPKTYAEMLQLQIDAKNSFDNLPVEIKKKFDNDYNVYLATAGSEDWYRNLGYSEQIEVPPEEQKVGDINE